MAISLRFPFSRTAAAEDGVPIAVGAIFPDPSISVKQSKQDYMIAHLQQYAPEVISQSERSIEMGGAIKVGNDSRVELLQRRWRMDNPLQGDSL